MSKNQRCRCQRLLSQGVGCRAQNSETQDIRTFHTQAVQLDITCFYLIYWSQQSIRSERVQRNKENSVPARKSMTTTKSCIPAIILSEYKLDSSNLFYYNNHLAKHGISRTIVVCFHSTARSGSMRYGTVRYGTVRYGTVRYGTVRYGTAYSEELCLARTTHASCR